MGKNMKPISLFHTISSSWWPSNISAQVHHKKNWKTLEKFCTSSYIFKLTSKCFTINLNIYKVDIFQGTVQCIYSLNIFTKNKEL